MDSNGRHRAASGSNLTLPTSSTFRRLPTLARSPFRRADKTSSQPTDQSISSSDPQAIHDVKRHEPSQSLGQLTALDQSTLSPVDDQSPNLLSGASFQLLPPSRTSSLPQTPFIDDSNTSTASQHPSLQGPTMVLSMNAGFRTSPDLSDLEPITYPAHLAQVRPSEPTQTAAVLTTRHRDGTLGSGSSVVLGAVPNPAETPALHTKLRDATVAAMRDSVQQMSTNGNNQEDSYHGRHGIHSGTATSSAGQTNERDGETDSGADETVVRRRKEGTKTMIERPYVPHREREPRGSERERNRKANSKAPHIAHATRALQPVLPSSQGAVSTPTSAMYFSLVPCYGRPPNQALRAHSGTLVGDRIWVIGGVDKQSCWRGVSWFDTETLQWTTIETQGEKFPPLRAHSTTLVGDKLYIFGGGDGPSYSNEVWVLDTVNHRFSKPTIGTPRSSLPPPRRAHTTVHYRNYLVVFGGGNGQAALNDVWALDVSDSEHLSWHEWKTKGDAPQKKGYHSANLVGEKMIVFGGSDGHASFADVHVLNLKTLVWTLVVTDVKHNRLSHTSTQVGSYLFIIGGHNGQTYAQDVLLFNLVTLQWETKAPRGVAPPGRGYHVALLHDARIFISGGYNGESVFDDLWALDLSAGAYLPQVTTFEIDETFEHTPRHELASAGGA